MKTTLPFCAVLLWAGALLAADGNPTDSLLNAAKQLAEKPNYSWKMSVEVPGDPTGTVEGQTEKGGATVFALARGDVTFDAVLQGTKGALRTEEGWKALGEVAGDAGPQAGVNRFVAAMVKGYKLPATEIAELAGKINGLKESQGIYAGELKEEAVKELLLYRTRGQNNPEVSGAKGSIRIWLKDGLPSKYEFKVQGVYSANGNDREVNRTHSIEIKGVGATKVVIPEAAKKVL